MKQTTLQKAHKEIDSMIFEQNGSKLIGLGSYCLDFKHSYVFLGYTKKGDKVILGDISSTGPEGVKIHKKQYGKIYERESTKVTGETVKQVRIATDGHRYSETLFEESN